MTLNKSKPRFLSIEDIVEGQQWEETVHITRDMVQTFISLSRDNAPVHVDQKHAVQLGYDRPLVHGFLVGSRYSGILGKFLPGSNTVIQKIILEMLLPVFVDDVLTYCVEISRVVPSVHSALLKMTAVNQNGELVNRGSATCIFRSQPSHMGKPNSNS
jgi:3-hydroxybutyryl-CoA dehydratase